MLLVTPPGRTCRAASKAAADRAVRRASFSSAARSARLPSRVSMRWNHTRPGPVGSAREAPPTRREDGTRPGGEVSSRWPRALQLDVEPLEPIELLSLGEVRDQKRAPGSRVRG